MKSLESAPQEAHITEETDAKIRELMDGPPSSNYNLRQIQLTIEKFVVEQPETTLDHDKLEEIMMEWEASDSSKGFRRIARHPDFKTHPRFHGDVARITLEDVQYSIKTKEMPKV